MKIVRWGSKLVDWKNHFFYLLDSSEQIRVANVAIFFAVVDLGTVAGRHKASGNINVIQLSPLLTEDEAKDTVGHEYAHLVDWYVNGQHEHGPSWKKIMCQLGLAPHETHDLPMKTRKALQDVLDKIDKHKKKP